jgi:hypothetical protein
MNPTRRSFMSLFAAAPLALVAAPALALEATATAPAAMPVPTGGLWTTLVRATDGTDPSTAIVTELPRFTPEIRALAGTTITLEGYLQPIGTGFGKAEYVMGRLPFHCAFCYTQGRASLALVRTAVPLPEAATAGKVTLRGTLVLQEERPDDYYYQLTDAQLV